VAKRNVLQRTLERPPAERNLQEAEVGFGTSYSVSAPVVTNDGFHLDQLDPADFEDLSVDLGPDSEYGTKSRREQLLAESLRQMREVHDEHRAAAKAARPAGRCSAMVCSHRTGQSKRRRRAVLYSLWNSGARGLLDGVTGIDWAIKRDLVRRRSCAAAGTVTSREPPLWSDGIKDAFEIAGEWQLVPAGGRHGGMGVAGGPPATLTRL